MSLCVRLIVIVLILKISTNAFEWVESPKFTQFELSSVIWGGGKFVTTYALGSSSTRICVSSNGVTWKDTTLSSSMISIIYADSQYVAVGSKNIYVSKDARTWKVVYTGYNVNMHGVTTVNGKYLIAVDSINGKSSMLLSSTLSKWDNYPFWQHSNSMFSNSKKAILHIGEHALLSTSDGLNWGEEKTPLDSTGTKSTSIRSVAWINNEFWLVGSRGVLLRSYDGTKWDLFRNDNYIMNGIAWGGGKYIAVGDSNSGALGCIFESINGKIWTKIQMPKRYLNTFNGIAYGNGVFVVVGGNGVILTSSAETNSIKMLNFPFANSDVLRYSGNGRIEVKKDENMTLPLNGGRIIFKRLVKKVKGK